MIKLSMKVVNSMQNKNFQCKVFIASQKVIIYQKVKLRTCILFYIIIHYLLTKDANYTFIVCDKIH